MRAFFGALLAAVALAGCDLNGDMGYVEIKTVPVAPVTEANLFLDSTKVAPVKNGQALLRMPVGSHQLRIARGDGKTALLCDLVVKKDRITTVTVSVMERPPRCVCRHGAGVDPPFNRTCVS